MDWNVTLQLAILVIAYIGGIGTIGYYITNALGKRVDDCGKRIDDLGNALGKRVDDYGKRIDDLRSDMITQNNVLREDMKEMRDTMREDMRAIRDELRKNNELLIAHISDSTLHN